MKLLAKTVALATCTHVYRHALGVGDFAKHNRRLALKNTIVAGETLVFREDTIYSRSWDLLKQPKQNTNPTDNTKRNSGSKIARVRSGPYLHDCLNDTKSDAGATRGTRRHHWLLARSPARVDIRTISHRWLSGSNVCHRRRSMRPSGR